MEELVIIEEVSELGVTLTVVELLEVIEQGPPGPAGPAGPVNYDAEALAWLSV